MPKTEAVAVAVVGYRSDDVLESFLSSVLSQSAQPSEVIVVDNSGPSESTRALAENAEAIYVPQPSNPGYGAAMNLAIAELAREARFVLICNPDLVLGPETVGLLMAAIEADPAIAAVGPLIRNLDGTVYPSARAIPSLSTGVGHALFHRAWPQNPWTRRYHAEQEAIIERDCGWLSGACLMVRRSALDAIGGFDEDYFMYFEDVDLGYRLGQAGWRNRYVPMAEVVHTGGHSTQSSAPQMTAAHHESAKRFLKKRYPSWWQSPVRVVTSIGLDVRRRVTA